jgi:hypothetical protein
MVTVYDSTNKPNVFFLHGSKSLHRRFIHSMAQTHRDCMRAWAVSVPMLCGLI